jgi:hypothetical protein
MFTDSGGTVRYAAHNLLTNSEQIDNVAWAKSNSNITADTTLAPDGTTTADTWTANSGTTTHRLDSPLLPFVDGGIYIASMHFKQGTARYVQITFGGGSFSGLGYANFDLQTGVVIATGGTLVASGIVAAANGFWRCYIVATCVNATTADSFLSYILATGSEARNIPVTTSGAVAVWGGQLERVTTQTTPGAYNKTTTAPYHAARFDYVSGVLKGLLLEGVSTNVLLYSEKFDNASWWNLQRSTVSANATVAPDGTMTADKLIEDSTVSDSHAVNQGFTYAAGIYIRTVFAKAAERSWFWMAGEGFKAYFNVSSGTLGTVTGSGSPTATIAPVANGWYRCTLSFTAPGGGNAAYVGLATGNGGDVYSGDGASGLYIWGSELKADAAASSYTPTGGATAMRAMDSLTLNWTAQGVADGTCYSRITYDNFSTSIIAGTVVSGSQTIAATSLARPWVCKVDYLAVPTVPPIRAVTLKDSV